MNDKMIYSLIKTISNIMHLKDSDDGDLCMLIFWTLSIVLIFKTRRFRDWICLRPQVNKITGGGGPTLLGRLEKASIFH
jgi:hypothetical protein